MTTAPRHKKGQAAIFAFVFGLLGIAVVATIYLVFDYVIFDVLQPELVDMGLNTSTQPQVVLRTSWDIWPVAFIFAWFLYMIVQAIRREPRAA